MNVKLERLPSVIITNADGSETEGRIVSQGLLRCICDKCEQVFYLEENIVVCCPGCRWSRIRTEWTRPITAFVAE